VLHGIFKKQFVHFHLHEIKQNDPAGNIAKWNIVDPTTPAVVQH
jgi:hypothetical protein